MQIKFSLSGGEWMIGDSVDKIYARVIDLEVPASLITSMWCDRDMLGSIDLSLSNISCSFSIVDAPAEDFIAIMRAFMHEDYLNEEMTRSLYSEMLALKKSYHEKEEDQGVLF